MGREEGPGTGEGIEKGCTEGWVQVGGWDEDERKGRGKSGRERREGMGNAGTAVCMFVFRNVHVGRNPTEAVF